MQIHRPAKRLGGRIKIFIEVLSKTNSSQVCRSETKKPRTTDLKIPCVHLLPPPPPRKEKKKIIRSLRGFKNLLHFWWSPIQILVISKQERVISKEGRRYNFYSTCDSFRHLHSMAVFGSERIMQDLSRDLQDSLNIKPQLVVRLHR